MLRTARKRSPEAPYLPLPEVVEPASVDPAAGAATGQWSRALGGDLGDALRVIQRYGLPGEVLAAVRQELYTRNTAPRLWHYTMISQQQLELALALIHKMKMPHLSLRAFNLILARLERDNSTVPFTYVTLAEALGTKVNSASTVLNDLARAGILIRRRVHGKVSYRVNENVAYYGKLSEREGKARTVPQLDLAV